MILLDTYALIGVVSEPARLSARARELAEDPANQLFVSAISALEIALAVQKQRLALPLSPRDWFERAVSSAALNVVDVSWGIALASAELPPHHATREPR